MEDKVRWKHRRLPTPLPTATPLPAVLARRPRCRAPRFSCQARMLIDYVARQRLEVLAACSLVALAVVWTWTEYIGRRFVGHFADRPLGVNRAFVLLGVLGIGWIVLWAFHQALFK